jgi:hypothetical protein
VLVAVSTKGRLRPWWQEHSATHRPARDPLIAPIPPSQSPATGLRVATDLFHQHMLDGLAPLRSPPLLWRSVKQWSDLLRAGELEAVLLASICPDLGAPPARVEGMVWLPLGRWGLLLASWLNGPDSAAASPPRTFRFLAPPVAASPGLHHALQEQQLAAITPLDAVAASDWLAELQRGDGLLPVPPSLLQTSPWREAALTAVWPWEPLVERLWLLIPQELASHEAGLAMAARLRERIAAAPGPAGGGSIRSTRNVGESDPGPS